MLTSKANSGADVQGVQVSDFSEEKFLKTGLKRLELQTRTINVHTLPGGFCAHPPKTDKQTNRQTDKRKTEKQKARKETRKDTVHRKTE